MKKYILLCIFLLNIFVYKQNEKLILSVGMELQAFWGDEWNWDWEDEWDWDWEDEWDWWNSDESLSFCALCGSQGDWDCCDFDYWISVCALCGSQDDLYCCDFYVFPEPKKKDDDPCDLPGMADPCECWNDCETPDPFDDSNTDSDEGEEEEDAERDCNGILGGSAYEDLCGECVGGNTGKVPCKQDCAGVKDGKAYFDSCNQCVGGTTNRKPCEKDCAGIWGGRAYEINCDGTQLCIDGNQGVFNNTLTGDKLNQFNQAKNDMMQNCLRAALLENLSDNYGLSVNSGVTSGLGTFNPCDYSISFFSNSTIDTYTLTGELFHAYQEQFLNGKLRQIQQDVANDHIGGSNIEFEEKAINMLAQAIYGHGFGGLAGADKLVLWCVDFVYNHSDFISNTFYFNSIFTFTDEEIDGWFEALREFQAYFEVHPSEGGFLYGKPIDTNMLPDTLLNLLRSSNCP